MSGPFERFTLSEDIIRFLVLSLIKPGDKMTLKMFLDKLYHNYQIVIGPEEYRKSLEKQNWILLWQAVFQIMLLHFRIFCSQQDF